MITSLATVNVGLTSARTAHIKRREPLADSEDCPADCPEDCP